MAEKGNFFDLGQELIDNLKNYLSLRIRLLKMEIAEWWVRFVADIILAVIVVAVAFFTLLFFSFAFAFWFGNETGNYPLGFLITGAFWVLLGLVIYLLRRTLLLDPITKYTTRDLLDVEEDSKVRSEDEL